MQVECGFTRVTTSEGEEYTFTPSLGRIADMGSPRELVELFAAVHGEGAAQHARYVLACLCDQPDPLPLIGGEVIDPRDPKAPACVIPARMAEREQIILAQHLLRHGMVGKARPGGSKRANDGEYAAEFSAAQYIAAATVHLGLSESDAEALSMTGFQMRFEMKFPEAAGKTDLTVADLDAAIEAEAERERARG